MTRSALLLLAAALGACAARAPAPDVPASAEAAAPDPGAANPATRGLPPGEGRAILARACVGCHDLGGLSAYRGYYDAARWRGLVETMIAHGAQLDETEVTQLVQYLAEHFGPGAQ
ncbi:MAG TPA: cytochrome c [Gammaproteobacteria bacterium]